MKVSAIIGLLLVLSAGCTQGQVCSPHNKCKRKLGNCVTKSEDCDGTLISKWCKSKDCACCIPKKTEPPTEPKRCKTLRECAKKGGKCISKEECEKLNDGFDYVFVPKLCRSKDESCGCCIPKKTESPTKPKECKNTPECKKKGGKCISKEECEKLSDGFDYVFAPKLCRSKDESCGCCIPKKTDQSYFTQSFGPENLIFGPVESPDGFNLLPKDFFEKTKKKYLSQVPNDHVCGFGLKSTGNIKLSQCKVTKSEGTSHEFKLTTKDLMELPILDSKLLHFVPVVAYNLNYDLLETLTNGHEFGYLDLTKIPEVLKQFKLDERKSRFSRSKTLYKNKGRNLGTIWGNGLHDPNENDRKQVDNELCKAKHPLNKVVRIEYTSGGVCTGTLVGPRHVLTAGHCIHENPNRVEDAGFFDVSGVVISPCGDDQSSIRVGWTVMRTVRGWAKAGDFSWDYALLTLRDKDTEGNPFDLGWMSFGFTNDLTEESTFNLNGYPSNLGGWTLAHDYDGTLKVTDKQVHHLLDTSGGQSGSGLYAYFSNTGKRVIYGVHNGWVAAGDYNVARRINRNLYFQICDWINDPRVC